MLDGVYNWNAYHKRGSLPDEVQEYVFAKSESILSLLNVVLEIWYYIISVCGNPLWLKILTSLSELLASYQPYLTCVLDSVWVGAIHRQPAGIKRSEISRDNWAVGICGWTVLCIAFQLWGQSRLLVTVVLRTLGNTRALQICVPAVRGPRGGHCLFQCRYSENISWGQITDDIERFLFLSVAELLPNPLFSLTPLSCALIFPKSRLQYCVSDSTLSLNGFFNYVPH